MDWIKNAFEKTRHLMRFQDKGYLLTINKYNENSIIIEAFTKKHGKYSGTSGFNVCTW